MEGNGRWRRGKGREWQNNETKRKGREMKGRKKGREARKNRKAGTCREGWNQWHSDAERGRVERQGDREKKVEMCRGMGGGG